MTEWVRPPDGARLEAQLGVGVALYDVSGLLPRTDAERRRPPSQIVRVYHHHSGATGRDGYEGLAASVRYVVQHRGFPGPAYTYWLPRVPDRDDHGRLVVYRCQPDEAVSWHTGGQANRHGVGVCWQGDLRAESPTVDQYQIAQELCAWLDRRHQLDPNVPHSTHAESGPWGGNPKAACPGPYVTDWVAGYESASMCGPIPAG